MILDYVEIPRTHSHYCSTRKKEIYQWACSWVKWDMLVIPSSLTFAKLVILLFEVQVYICCLFADGDVANGN